MHTLVVSAGIRIKDELWIKAGIQNSVNGVVQQAVANGRLMNVARLRVVYSEGLIRPVPVSFIGKLAMKRDDVARKIQRKFGDIFTSLLAA